MVTNAKIILKKSSVAAKVPLVGDLEYGELALNYEDGVIHYKNSSNAIVKFLDSGGTVSAARSSVSVTNTGGDGSLTYSASTGVISYTGPSPAEVRTHLSAGTGIAYDSGTGVISSTGSSGGVTISEGPPASPTHADQWWSKADGFLYIYYTDSDTSQWVGAVPGGGGLADSSVEEVHMANASVGTIQLIDLSVTEGKIGNDAVSSVQLKTLSTLLIKNSAGSTLKTIHGAGV